MAEPSQIKQQEQAAAPAAGGVGRYISERDRMVDELQAVQVISEALAGKLELEPVVSVAVGWVAEIAGAETSSVFVIDADTDSMTCYAATGSSAEKLKAIPVPAGQGICGHVAGTGQTVIIQDAQNDPRLYRKADDTTGFVTRNMLAVPIRTSERTWGVLELINNNNRAI